MNLVRPEYVRAAGPRLRRAAAFLSDPDPPPRALVQALQDVLLITEDELPADFLREFGEIWAEATVRGSIEDTVQAMKRPAVRELAEKVRAFSRDVLGPF